MSNCLTLNEAKLRVQAQLGVVWNADSHDRIWYGWDEATITGIATTYAATPEVLQRAVAKGINLIIARVAPNWIRPDFYLPASEELVNGASAYQAKVAYVAEHGLAVWQLAEHWDVGQSQARVRGLARALAWGDADGEGLFTATAPSLGELAIDVQQRLALQGMRVIGEARATIERVALIPGLASVAQVRQALEQGADTAIAGEPVEWEASPYFEDAIAAGLGRGIIFLGQQASMEPASGEMQYFTNDGNFNTTALIDANSGAVVERYQYDPYGKMTVLNGASGAEKDPNVAEWSPDA